MAHPSLTGRVDRRVALAAGAAAALLGLPASAHALPLDDVADDGLGSNGLGDVLECITAACDDQAALVPEEAAGPVSEATSALPEPVKALADPVTSVVDDVVKSVPAVEDTVETVEKVPAVVEDVVRGVEPAAPSAPTPVDPAPSPGAPSVGTAGDSPGVVSGPRQGPVTATPPFTFGTGTTAGGRAGASSSQAFLAPPVITAPFTADLSSIAEEFMSRTPVSAGVDALRDAQGSTVPGPDAPSWLLATAGGLLLLVGSGHLLRARQRYTASVAH